MTDHNRGPRKAILFSSAALLLITVFLKVLGFGEKRVLAHFLGGGDDLDVFFTAVKISGAVYFILRGILRPAVIPLLVAAKNESPEKARNFGFSLALITVALMGVFILVGEVFTARLVSLFAEGFPPEKQRICVHLTRCLLPVSIAMALSQLLAISLQVRKRFVYAALGECVQKGFFIALVVAFALPFGSRGLIGACLVSYLIMLAYYAATHLDKFRFGRTAAFSGQDICQTAQLAWPLIIGSAVSQVGRLVQNRFASSLDPGSVTALTFAQTTVDLPIILVPLSLSVVLFPYFSEFSNRKEMERSVPYLAHTTRFLLILFVPAAAYVFLFREPVTDLLWHSGKFGQESVRFTATALAGFASGLPFMALEIVFMVYFYAQKRMIPPMVCGLVSTVLALGSLPFLTERFGLAGVSAFIPLARALKIGMLVWCLRLLEVRVPWRRSMTFLIKLLAAMFLALGVYGLVAAFLFSHLPILARPRSLGLAASSFVLVFTYLAGLKLTGLREYGQMRDAFWKAGYKIRHRLGMA
jgi:putative peptidoglycan lipid II flippase